jgi:general L-amino acid transport system substrate-binding protein
VKDGVAGLRVSQGLLGFSIPMTRAIDRLRRRFRRAVAAAVLNDGTKVQFTPLSSKDRFEPLREGIDLLRNTT